MKRLDAIANMVPLTCTVADIGCDHGLLAKILVENKKANCVIATDISKSSLAKAEALARINQLPIVTRHGDGLTVLKEGEAQFAVICGMGGFEILHILSDKNRTDGIGEFLVSPHSEFGVFRAGLEPLGLKIVEEQLIRERKHWYFLIRLTRGHAHYTPTECEYGLLIHAPTQEFRAYIEHKIKMLEEKQLKFGHIVAFDDELTLLRQLQEGK